MVRAAYPRQGNTANEGVLVRRSRSLPSGLVLVVVLSGTIPDRASAQPPPASSLAPTVSSQQTGAPKAAQTLTAAEAERTFKELLQRYFEAYARKDIEGMTTLWHTGGPARYRRNVVLVEFDLRQVDLAGLTVHNAGADPGGGRARAILELRVTNTKTKRVRNERRIRDFTFLQDDSGAWKIWNEVSPAGELARRLLAVPADQRDALIASEPELSSDDTLAGLTNEAGRLQGLQKPDEVLDALGAQGRLARALGNQDVLGTSLMRVGSLRMMTGRYPEASEAFTAAREAFVTEENQAEIAACDANLANLAYMQGRFAEAGERYQQAFDVFEKQNDDARMASTLHGLGNALYMQTDFSRALEYYTRAVTVLQRTKDRFREASVLQAIAMVHKELGDYAPAADAWRQSLALTEAGGDVAAAARAWSGLGEIFRLQGDLGRALQHHLKSLQLWEQVKSVATRAASTYAIGQLYALQRNFARAIEFYQKALELDQSITDDLRASEGGQARDLGGLGGAHLAQGQPDVALGEYEKSLLLREHTQDEVGVMWTLVHMGVLHTSQHRPDEAEKAFERSLALAESRYDQDTISTILALRGQLELDEGKVDAALASAARAAELAVSIEHFDTVAYARVVTGRAHQKAERAAEARAAYEDAISALGKVPLGPAAETFFDNRRAPYLAMVDLLAGQGNLAEAFRWSERGRQQVLADMLGGDGAVVSKGLTTDERDLERTIARDLRTLAVKLRRERGRQKPDATRLAALQAEQGTRQVDRDALRRRIYDAHPTLRAMRAQGEPSGPEAASVLGTPAAALVSFVVGETRTWVFALAKDPTAGTWGVQKVAAIDVQAADLSRQVRRFREAIAKKDNRAVEIGRELHTLLLEPVQEVLARKSRLVIVPDAFLWSLPFEALQTSVGHFLVEDASVTLAPSLTGLVALDSLRPEATSRRALVAFGKPVLGRAIEERLALVRPAAPTAQPPAADREVEGVALLFGPSRSRTFLGDQARVERLAQGVAPGTILHLAVPTVLTEATPLFSVIALTPSDSADAATGLVEVASLISWNLPAEAAVVSRLEYGPGSGEGAALTTLAWLLFVGGTPTLVANRWLVGPTDASVGTRFYRAHLARTAAGAPAPRAAESLQRAMKGILAQPATRHPFYWAGFMTIGR